MQLSFQPRPPRSGEAHFDGRIDVDRIPDSCPLCGRGVNPVDVGAAYAESHWAEKVYRCPFESCGRFFVAQYRVNLGTRQGTLHNCIPVSFKGSTFSGDVEEISPDFIVIYNQAEAAESANLTRVCGPGYRKALEFLVKDYAQQKHPDKAEEIKTMFLGKCIDQYVSNDPIKEITKRAAWLGNDETHYVRRWEDLDLKDLKMLILLCIKWIEMEALTESIKRDMPDT